MSLLNGLAAPIEVRRGPPGPIAGLIWHVLAHIPSSGPGGCYQPEYVQYCASRLGNISERYLLSGVRALRRWVSDAELGVSLQRLAWLVGDAECLGDELDWLELWPAWSSASSASQYERATRELHAACVQEQSTWSSLEQPPNTFLLQGGLTELLWAAPLLRGKMVRELMPLWRAGRALPTGEIWVGVAEPGYGPPLGAVLWQACHEATVLELSEVGIFSFEEIELGAVVLLAERMRRGDYAEALRWAKSYTAWRARLAPGLPNGAQELRQAGFEAMAREVERRLAS